MYWARGYQLKSRKAAPVIKLPKNSTSLSFLNLVELYVVSSITRDHNVRFAKVRDALKYTAEGAGFKKTFIR